MTILAIFGCAPSTRELPATLEGLSIEAIVEQTTEQLGSSGEGFIASHASVALQDREGRTLEREDLRFELNDVPLRARSEHDHFYDRHPFYRLDGAAVRIAADAECRFTLVWPDGTHHIAAAVRTPMELSPAQFNFPRAASRDGPLAIDWTDLPEAAELVVFRSHAYTDVSGNVVLQEGSATDPTALRRTIGPGLLRRPGGRLEIPSSYLADHDGRRVSGVGVEISVTHDGFVEDPFSKKSTVRATRRLVFRTELVD